MSMSEPLTPKRSDVEDADAPAAAEPGPEAQGTPATEEPDILPNLTPEPDENVEVSHRETVFRTPVAGERLSAEELEESTPDA
jgi:hypothetical protein